MDMCKKKKACHCSFKLYLQLSYTKHTKNITIQPGILYRNQGATYNRVKRRGPSSHTSNDPNL